jgi:hypothetical protein
MYLSTGTATDLATSTLMTHHHATYAHDKTRLKNIGRTTEIELTISIRAMKEKEWVYDHSHDV